MSDRRRINISVDPHTYDVLQRLTEKHGYKNACELLVAFAHILIDRLADPEQRQYDIPDEDGAYIEGMFEDLGHVQRTPDGTVPVRHNTKSR